MLATLMRRMNITPDDLLAMQENLASLSIQGTGLKRRPPPSWSDDMSEEETAQFFKDYKEWFEEDRLIPPEPAPHIDRAGLVAEQARRRRELDRTARQDTSGVQFYRTMVGFAKHSSSTPIADLKPSTYPSLHNTLFSIALLLYSPFRRDACAPCPCGTLSLVSYRRPMQ